MTAPTRRVEGLVPERAVLGATLFAIGATILAASVIPEFDRYTLLIVSAICLAAFAVSREYGFAIPAGITGGIGSMVLLTSIGSLDPMASGSVFFLSIATGFAAIWVLGLVADPVEKSPWPLAPAAALGTIGVLLAARQPAAFDWVQIGLATAFVIGGVAMILRRGHR